MIAFASLPPVDRLVCYDWPASPHKPNEERNRDGGDLFFFFLSLSSKPRPPLRDADLATIAALSFVASALFCSRWTAISRAAGDRIRLSCVFIFILLFFYYNHHSTVVPSVGACHCILFQRRTPRLTRGRRDGISACMYAHSIPPTATIRHHLQAWVQDLVHPLAPTDPEAEMKRNMGAFAL